MLRIHKPQGFTLIELVIALTVVGVGLGAFLTLILETTARSADPIIYQQANAIAQSYLEEALINPFCDPDDYSTDCPADCNAAAIGGGDICSVCGGGSESRPDYDDVCDYDAINDTTGALDKDLTPIGDLDAYNIDVIVTGSGVSLNGLSSANGEVVRIDVKVTHDRFSDLDLTLSSYKANY